jgi:hypothetical protein
MSRTITVGATVATLQRDPPRQRLDVIEPRLGVDGDGPSRPANDRIPRALIARSVDGNLRPPREPWPKVDAKASQQRELRPIPDRLTRREGSQGEIEADRGCRECKRFIRDVRRFAALDAADFRV